MKKEIDLENLEQNTIPSGSVFGTFKNHVDSKETISLILDRGYKIDEIEINPPDMGTLIPNPSKNHHPSGNEFMNETLKGLKFGAIFGLISSIVIVGLVLLTSEKNENSSILFSFSSGIIVGIIWGSMLGFFIGPHLPKSIWRIFSKSPLDNTVTVSFEAHNMVDALYFSKKGRLKIVQ
ncbi:hypothetical protein MMU07_10920 [Aquiflexum sp. LQ15W]|uniref:hypothetical protein n=1 Tax=Cognataquiflexum nitidum TaxID=2922272 RepID=UPI001F12B45B|nr:hypothetical protein [Cognataquiflexum nitidum]MCH6200097.1 hypothetical protein [Cognataquiflexum nitidum]